MNDGQQATLVHVLLGSNVEAQAVVADPQASLTLRTKTVLIQVETCRTEDY